MIYLRVLVLTVAFFDVSFCIATANTIEKAEENLYKYRGETYLLDESIIIANQLLIADKHNERALVCIAAAYFQKAYTGNISHNWFDVLKAYSWVEKALAVNNKNSDIIALQALYVLYLKGPKQSESIIKDVQGWRASFVRGMIAAYNSDLKGVEQHLLEASQLAPLQKKAFIVNHIGVVLATKGFRERASFFYKNAIALDPDFAWPYYNLGLYAEDIGNKELANQYAKEALERMEFEYALDLDERSK